MELLAPGVWGPREGRGWSIHVRAVRAWPSPASEGVKLEGEVASGGARRDLQHAGAMEGSRDSQERLLDEEGDRLNMPRAQIGPGRAGLGFSPKGVPEGAAQSSCTSQHPGSILSRLFSLTALLACTRST